MTNALFAYENDVLTCKEYGNHIRWQQGERLDHLFEESCDTFGDQAAVDCSNGEISYKELDSWANKVARFLLSKVIKNGDRVGLLFPNSEYSYVGQLGVLKANAAYVPFDASFPRDRIAYICKDAGIKTILTLSQYKEHAASTGLEVICLDEAAGEIEGQDDTRMTLSEKGEPKNELCYIIYTSGTTGNPKGVPIDHASICNFVRVAAEVYGYQQSDRVYQGMTIAFDFSVEELWVPWIAGATLVPGKVDTKLVGCDLADYLSEKKITALCCVPTLLATIERDLPDLRLLLVSGEACPQDLVSRWKTPDRVMLNVYGPTETTVTATWIRMEPGNAVTIGGPLPSYSIVILDEHEDKVVTKGENGEVAIAGVGLARGYLNREDLTEKVFIKDFLDLPNNPSKRIYRSGDLGRITENNEIEYLGRIDTQVKIRGYRIELMEIEAVLLEVPEIVQAVVDTYEVEAGTKELVAYCTLASGVEELPSEEISKALKTHLPAYMIPGYIEILESIPMTTSNKADRKKLPAPVSGRFIMAGGEYFEPENATQRILETALCGVLKVKKVSIRDDFFKDLGAHSLLMAQFSAEIKKNLPNVQLSIRDIYFHPTIETLSGFLDESMVDAVDKVKMTDCRVPTDFEYYSCGLLQTIYYSLLFVFGIWMMLTFANWMLAATSVGDLYLRVVSFSMVAFIALVTIPIAIKWLVVGKFKSQKFPLWSLAYFRFWMVKNLIQSNPILMFSGTPLYSVYLRLLGAKIGKNCMIQSRLVPVCTDLLSIGNNTVLHKDSLTLGYKAEAGYLHCGPISIGNHSFVGEGSVLDINTVMESETELAHGSSLQEGQCIPNGKSYHGNPAEETECSYNKLEGRECSSLRRWIYTAILFVNGFFVVAPLFVCLWFYLFPSLFGTTDGLAFIGANIAALPYSVPLYAVVLSLIILVGTILLGLLSMAVFSRLLGAMLKTDKVYVLYGFHYYIYSALGAMTNSRYFNVLFGDSSFIVYFLKSIGYSLPKLEQTGSNFGNQQKHDVPTLCEIGSGTIISDGLSMVNHELSHNSFRVSKVTIGAKNFFGNNILYPANGKTGENCLLATKVMVPVDGETRENIGLLGAPSFEIPRTVARDVITDVETLRARELPNKNRYNFYTILIYLLPQWGFLFLSLMFFGWSLVLLNTDGEWYFGGALAAYSFGAIIYWGLVSRWSYGFRKMVPFECSIYDARFWLVERYWKLNDSLLQELFKGTVFRNTLTRLRGGIIGSKVFDDGCSISEKHLASVGDYCNLNEGSVLQGHSLEDGVFKSDYITMGTGCTVGANAYVQYGATFGDHSVLTPDSFLMKGEVMGPNSKWQGNPAEEV